MAYLLTSRLGANVAACLRGVGRWAGDLLRICDGCVSFRTSASDRCFLNRFLALVLCAGLVAAGVGSANAAQSQSYYYDPAGRLIVVVDPASGSATYNYDANGNIVSVVRSPLTSVVAAQVSPSAAAAGATVTIFGTGFGTTANTSVTFNGVAAAVSAATATSLTVTVPSGATTGTVKVTAPGGTSTTSYSFTVLMGTPTVSSVPSGALVQGATMTIGGTKFDTTPANDVVIINGVRAQVTAATATQLTVVVPVCVGVSPVQVETASGVGVSAGSVTILPAGATAANLQAVVASTLGSSANVSFDGTGRAVMVTFPATQGQSVVFNFPSASSADLNAQLALFAPDGSSLYNDLSRVGVYNDLQSSNEFGPYSIASTGVYSLWIAPPTSAGTATVSLVSVPAPATASLTTSGTPVGLTTTVPGQPMQATFTATGGQTIALQLTSPLPNSGTNNWDNNLTLTVTGPNGAIFAGNVSVNGFTGAMTLPASGTGTYTVTATPSSHDFGTLNFTFYNVPASASAVLTANGSSTVLTTTTPGQTFAPTFTATAGQVISLNLQVMSGTLASNGSQINITGPSGQVYSFPWAWFYGSSHFTGPITLPTAGVYTITDIPDDIETGSLQFTLYTVPPPAAAVLTANGTPTVLTTTAAGQTFAPTFTATAGQVVALDLQVQSGTLVSGGDSLAITGPSGQVWSYGWSWYYNYPNDTHFFSGPITLPSAGAYTITDAPGGTETGALQFMLYTVPPPAHANLTIGGAAVALSTTTPAQQMILTFNATAGQTISLLANNYTGSLASAGGSVVILAPDGTTQAYSGSLQASSTYSGNVNLTQTGAYTITVTPSFVATGGATFQLYNEAAVVSTLTPGGGSIGLTTTSPDQTMKLTMPETSGHRVAVLVQLSTALASSGNQFSIVDPDGSTQLYNFSGVNGTSLWTGPLPSAAISSTVPTLTQTGNYSVSLTPQNLAQGLATFTAYDVPADLTGTVSVGHNATFNVTAPGQGLRATYAGTGSAKATFTVTPTSVNPTSVCFNVTVLETDGVTALNGGQACSGAYSSSSLTLPSSGNYLVVAVPSVPATGTFTVGVTSP